MEDTTEHLRRLATRIVDAALERVPLRAAILLGSGGRGDADFYSDIDLLLYRRTRGSFSAKCRLASEGEVTFMEHAEEFEALYELRDPYQDLLQHGHVERWTSDPEGLRAELRRQARQDKIRVRTFRYGDHVLAVRLRKIADEDLANAFRLMSVQEEAGDRARLLGHEAGRWHVDTSRWQDRGSRAGFRCTRCGARLYIEHSPQYVIVEGEAVEDPCG